MSKNFPRSSSNSQILLHYIFLELILYVVYMVLNPISWLGFELAFLSFVFLSFMIFLNKEKLIGEKLTRRNWEYKYLYRNIAKDSGSELIRILDWEDDGKNGWEPFSILKTKEYEQNGQKYVSLIVLYKR